MESVKLNPPNLGAYPEAYRHIRKAMFDHGVDHLGDINRDSDGTASLDLSKMGRIERTLCVMNLTLAQIEFLHAYEYKKKDFVYAYPQMMKITRAHFDSMPLNEKRVDAVAEFNDEHRPEQPKFQGVTIPPYFPGDYDFDGLQYHHAWDKSVMVNRNRLYLPPLNSRRSGGRTLAEAEA